MARCIEKDEGQTAIVMFQLDEDDLHAACTHRLHMFGSDGLPWPGTKPHPSAYGTFPCVAGRLRTEGWFPLEDAVRRMTSAAAQRFSLGDRGPVRPGMLEDLVLFEDSIQDRATFDSPTELPVSVCHVCVAGEAIVAYGCRPAARTGNGSFETAGGFECARPATSRMWSHPPGSYPMR